MTYRPVWFGPEQRPLFGWLHEPDGAAVSVAVVVCNSLGAEAQNAKPAIKQLCERLAEAGATSLRFDYDGTGDSAGELRDSARVPAWLASIEAAINRVREVGFDRVALVGIRMGALLAACTAPRSEVDLFVMWDPCESSTTFMREQRLLFDTQQLGTTTDADSTEGLSYVFSRETVADLSALRPWSSLTSDSRRVLVLTRTGRPIVDEKCQWQGSSRTSFGTAEGQDELLDRRIEQSVIPESSILKITSWITDGATEAVMAGGNRVGQSLGQTTLVVQGERVVESPLFAGETPLFGILTEPPRSPNRTIVFLSMGRLDHVGPGRLWTDLARSFASRGFRCLRVDGNGIGESNRRQTPDPGDTKRGPDDVRDVVTALGETDASSFVLVGVSSGGFHAANALSLEPAGICLINPALTSEMRDIWRSAARHKLSSAPESLTTPAFRNNPVKWLRYKYLRFKIRLTSWISVARAGSRGVPTLLILADSDVRNFTSNPAWWVTRRLLESRGLLRVEVLPYNDHSLESLAMRDLVAKKLHSWITDRYEDHEPALEAL